MGADESLAAELAALRVAHAHTRKSLREAEERLSYLHELATIARIAPDIDALMRASLTLLGRKLEVQRAVYGELDPDGNRVFVSHDYADGCASIAGEHRLSDFGPRFADAIRSGKGAFVINDVSEEFPEIDAKVLEPINLRAVIAFVLVRNGVARAIVSVNDDKPRTWSQHEVELVRETVERCWSATEQRTAEKRLEEHIAQLRIAGRIAKVGGWSVDLTSGRVLWSEQLFAIHEMPVGSPPSMRDALASCAPEFLPMAKATMNACIRDGTPFDTELQIITKTGRRVWIRAIGSAERDASGKIIGLHGALQDIDERRRLEDQLRQAQKMEAIGRLAGGVAHDFGNLLAVILSYSAYLIRGLPSDDPLRGDLEQIHGAGKRASELTRQLLTFSSQQAITPRRLDLREVVGGLERMLRRVLGDDVTFSVTKPSTLAPVWADQGQLEQVIMNLVLNARDAVSVRGAITIELADAMRDEGPRVMLAVKDNGHGMDEATRARIFEPFFTTKDRGKGTGLGLATVYGIVTQSGGQIEVESAIGAGTTFRVYLPRTDVAADAVRTKPLDSRAPAASSEAPKGEIKHRERILHVDDEETLVVLTARILKKLGYHVSSFTDSVEAAQAFEAAPDRFDAVVTDIDMPSLNGFELVRRLRKTRPEVPFVITSGAFRAEDIRVAESLHLHALVVKPDTVDELGRVLDAELKGSSACFTGS
jgi:signal transduction histidine kinase/ActR/RegA family two-component response regulator